MYSKQKSLNFGHYVPNDKVLNKKVPENPKYKHVKPAIDTGKNIRKHIDDLKEKQKNCIYKKDEVFKRIKVSTFLKLVAACATEINSHENENDMGDQPSSSNMPGNSNLSERRCVANVLMGVGELDLINSRKKMHSASVKSLKPTPYLLLDVRDKDAFSQCHIITAKHYPSTMLSRSNGYEIEDMKLYKNHMNTIIILYDDDETAAVRVATTLVERGYENVYLLTGGLKLALEICPHGLTTSSQFSPVHMLTQAAASYSQKNSKEYFTPEDIAAIQCYVDTYPNRGNNYVLSSQSSQSRKSQSFGSYHRSCRESAASMSHSSTASRRESSCASTLQQKHQQSVSSKNSRQSHSHSNCTKSLEQMHFKPAIDDKPKKPKRAPWK